ncbi:hypothetical protein [Sphingobacterium deserti]|uniref:Lipoprotein n=1 Tax=Sphingobacterium deserti TaxID=1229276 RepID=A0A0B8T131_9SPHI|nr:hypothetical protein [Sphingobacterium deserti]KGE12348.1 hypothetical protein DI53_3837 [Sphingobacterium deserti]
MKIQSIFKTTLAVALLSTTVLATSCDKENDASQLELQQAQAATPYTITGQWGSPFNPTGWTKVYVNFATASQSTSSTSTHQVAFERQVNGNIAAGSGYQLRYIAKAIDNVSAADWSSATAAASIGSGIWYNYDTSTNDYEAVDPLTVIVATSTGTPVYAVKLVRFDNIQQTGSGSSLQVKADPVIEYKAL